MEAEEKKQKRRRRKFTDEFKAGAVSLVLDEGKLPSEVARNLDLTASSFLGDHPNPASRDLGKSGQLSGETLTSARRQWCSVSVRRAPSGRARGPGLHDRAWRDGTSGRSGSSNGLK